MGKSGKHNKYLYSGRPSQTQTESVNMEWTVNVTAEHVNAVRGRAGWTGVCHLYG